METTRRRLDRLAVEAQRDSRTPALAAGVAHRGELLWSAGVGTADLADPAVPLGADTQFLIASNTKTFTAAMVLQLRDEGRLRLDDPVDDHLPGSDHPGVTVRQLLAHASGMQRDPVLPEFWDTLEVPPTERFVADTFSAMTTDRPYRAALSKEETIRRLRAGRGTQFDPEMLDIFLALVANGRLVPPERERVKGDFDGDL